MISEEKKDSIHNYLVLLKKFTSKAYLDGLGDLASSAAVSGSDTDLEESEDSEWGSALTYGDPRATGFGENDGFDDEDIGDQSGLIGGHKYLSVFEEKGAGAGFEISEDVMNVFGNLQREIQGGVIGSVQKIKSSIIDNYMFNLRDNLSSISEMIMSSLDSADAENMGLLYSVSADINSEIESNLEFTNQHNEVFSDKQTVSFFDNLIDRFGLDKLISNPGEYNEWSSFYSGALDIMSDYPTPNSDQPLPAESEPTKTIRVFPEGGEAETPSDVDTDVRMDKFTRMVRDSDKQVVEALNLMLKEDERLSDPESFGKASYKYRSSGEYQYDQNVLKSAWNSMSSGPAFLSTDPNKRLIKAYQSALQEDGDLTPTTFRRSAFYGQEDSVAKGFAILEDKESGELTIDFNTDSLRSFVSSKVDELSNYSTAMERAISSIAVQNGAQNGEETIAAGNRYRKSLLLMIDDFCSSISLRDSWARSEYLKTPGAKAANANKLRASSVVLEPQNIDRLAAVIGSLTRPTVNWGWFFESKKNLDGAKIFKDNSDQDKFSKIFLDQIKGKIRRYFTSPGRATESITKHVGQTIMLDLLVRNFRGKNVATISPYYEECTLCGKTILSRVEVKGSEDIDLKEKQKFQKTIDYQQYSLERDDTLRASGQSPLINIDELRGYGPFSVSDEEAGDIKKIYSSGSYEVAPKTWDEMESDYYSNDKNKHTEAVLRKSFAIRALGGKKVGRKTSILTKRFECPYSASAKDQQSLFSSNSKKETRGSRLDWSCGLTVSASSLSNKSPELFQPGAASDERFLLESLDAALESGDITEEFKSSVLNREFGSTKQTGGWRFSSKIIACPTMISTDIELSQRPNETDDGYKKRFMNILSKYSIIASPVSGPISPSSYQNSSGGYTPGMYGVTGKVSDGLGGHRDVEDGTLAYLVCGSLTSFSQFDRVSLQSLISKFVSDVEGEAKALPEIISSLIELGVDPSDIAPLIRAKNIRSAVSDMESSGRMNKISGLLSVAMALRGSVSVKDKMSALGGLSLVCKHGHKFSVSDSLNFANTHAYTVQHSKSRSSRNINEYRENIFNSKMLTTSGRENMLAVLGFDANDSKTTGLQEASPYVRVRRSEVEGYPGFVSASNWEMRKVELRKVYWTDPDNEDYVYILGSASPHAASRGLDYSMFGGRKGSNPYSTIQSRAEKDQALEVRVITVDANTTSNEIQSSQQDGKVADLFDSAAMEKFEQDQNAEGEGVSRVQLLNSSRVVANLIKTYLVSMNEFLSAAASSSVKTRLSEETGSKYKPSNIGSFSSDPAFLSGIESIVDIVFGSAGLTDSDEDISRAKTRSAARAKELFESYKHDDTVFYASLSKGYHNIIYKITCMGIISALNELQIDSISGAIRSLIISESGDISLNYSSQISTDINDHLRSMAEVTDYSENIEVFTKSLDKHVNMRETEYAQRIILAASGYAIADGLSKIWNLYFSRTSPNYLEISPSINFSYDSGGQNPYPATSIDIDDVYLASSSMYYSEEKLSELFSSVSQLITDKGQAAKNNDLYDKLRLCRNELITMHRRVPSLCRSNRFRELGLAHIKDSLSSRVQALQTAVNSSGLSSDEIRSKNTSISRMRNIVDLIMTNTGATTIDLSSSGKYAAHHAGIPDMLPTSHRFSAGVLDFCSARISALKIIGKKPRGGEIICQPPFDYPIYVLNQSSAESLGINLTGEHVGSGIKVLLGKKNHVEEFLSWPEVSKVSHRDISDEAGLPDSYARGGWSVYATKFMESVLEESNVGVRISHEPLMIYNHPGTERVSGDDGDGYVNSYLNIDTRAGLHIGQYGSNQGATGAGYPPLQEIFVNPVGIPIPIEYDTFEKDGKAKHLPAKNVVISSSHVPVQIGNYNINISDFLQRAPVDDAFSILSKIEALWIDFDTRRQKISESGGSEDSIMDLEDSYKKIISDLFIQYKSMPLMVKRFNKTSFNKNPTNPGGSTLAVPAATGYYVPLVNSTLMASLTEKECFSPEWGGHTAWNPGRDDSQDIISALHSFNIQVNGLDNLSDIINKRYSSDKLDAISTQEVSPEELLRPHRLFSGENSILSKVDFGFGFAGILEDDTGRLNTEFLSYKKNAKPVDQMYLKIPEYKNIIPKYHPIGGGGYGDEDSDDGRPRFVVDSRRFRRSKKERDMGPVNSMLTDTPLLSSSDFSAAHLSSYYGKKGKGGAIIFAKKMEDWFIRRFKSIAKIMEEDADYASLYDAPVDPDTGLTIETQHDPSKIITKISSNIHRGQLVGYSDDNNSPIYSDVSVDDEELSELLLSSV
jgi:hypothetical protein